jgi:uncharacterized protein (UPF0276 family)
MSDNNNVLGLGLDFQYANDYAFGNMQRLCDQFRPELSHISIVSIPTTKEAVLFKKNICQDLPAIHHLSNIAPADPEGPNLERLIHQSDISDAIDAKWCLEDIGIWNIGPYSIPYFVPPIFDSQVAALIAERIHKIHDHIKIPFLAEIPSCSFVVGEQPIGQFFHQIIDDTDCKMVLDVSHVFSYALATDQKPLEILYSLPCDAVWEIHVAGGRVNKTHSHRYIDTHSDPVHDEVITILSHAIARCPNLKAITYEIGVRSTQELISNEFARLTQCIHKAGFAPSIS